MAGRTKNSWKQISDARLECMAKEFIRIELELVQTFVQVAHTKYSMGDVEGGDFSRNSVEKVHHEALNYFGKLSEFTSSERWTLMDLVHQAKRAIATLQNAATLDPHSPNL